MKKEKVLEYHKDNPHIYQEFRKMAYRKCKERKYYSGFAIIELIRWETKIGSQGDQMIDSNAAAQRHFEASDCLDPDGKLEAEAAIERAVEASHRRLSNAEIELVSTRASSYEGVLGKARYAWYLAANTTEERATGPNSEMTGPLDNKAFLCCRTPIQFGLREEAVDQLSSVWKIDYQAIAVGVVVRRDGEPFAGRQCRMCKENHDDGVIG